MALVYKPSDPKAARAYERSSGMEPNPGVSHLTVVGNPGGRSVRENPFQWVQGRGQRHRHVSKPYDKVRDAIGWKKRNKRSDARLYPVDEKGTIVSRPLRKKLLSNRTSRRTGMAYNIGALRRAMRSNPKRRRSSVREEETAGGVKVRSRGRRKPKRNRSTRRRKSVAANRRRRTSRKKVAANRRRRSRRTSRRPRKRKRKTRRNSRRKSVAANRRRRSRRSSRKSSKRSRAAKKGWRRRRARASSTPNRRRSRRTSKRRRSRRRVSANRGRRTSRRRASRRRVSRRRVSRNAKRGGKRRASVKARGKRTSKRTSKRRGTKRGRKRRTSRKPYYWGRRRVSARGKEYLDKYLMKGYMPSVAPVYHTGKSKSGAPAVLVYPIPAGQGRLSRRKTRRRSSYKRGGVTRRRKSRAVGASYRGRRRRRMTANRKRRTSRRSSRRRRSRRRSSRKPGMYRNRRRSRRRSSRRSSRRRSSRRRSSRRRLTRNLLSTSKVQYSGRGKYRAGRPRGKRHQVVMYGSKSKGRPGKGGRRRRITGYPVYVPGHVVERASVRRFKRLGGAAKDANARARRRGYSERRWPKRRVKRNTRRTSMRRNRRKSRRRSSRRRSTRRNPRWVVANRHRRRRRIRKNQAFFGADLMKDVVTPVVGGTAGFVAARVLSNGLANIEGIRNLLDKDKPAAEAANTKIAANVLGIVATLGLATQVKMIKDNQGALVTGMGLALADRLLGRVTGEAAQYLSGFGEYVSQPLGEYVSQPLGAYVNDGMGEYVSQPLGETLYAAAGMGAYAEGVDPADQAGTDSLMDTMEAAAGFGQTMAAAAGMGNTLYATAGMGDTLYAAAGLGAEADASLKAMYQKDRIPFSSIHTPTGVARPVSASLPFSRPVPSSMVTPEGKGYAGGLFARHLFAGMF